MEGQTRVLPRGKDDSRKRRRHDSRKTLCKDETKGEEEERKGTRTTEKHEDLKER